MQPTQPTSTTSPQKKHYSPYFYLYKPPSHYSIYPLPTHSETLSLLNEINSSRPPSKRLPNELLLRIREAVQEKHPSYKSVLSKWTPITTPVRDAWRWEGIHSFRFIGWDDLPLARTRIDPVKKRFYITQPLSEPLSSPEMYLYRYGSAGYKAFMAGQDGHASITYTGLHKMISSPDLLYRVRCLFPNIFIYPDEEGNDDYDVVWFAGLRHNETGMALGFTEWQGKALVKIDWGESLQEAYPFDHVFKGRYEDLSEENKGVRREMKRLGRPFSEDAVGLLNLLVGALEDDDADDGGKPKQYPFFHPAANADVPTASDGNYFIFPRIRGSSLAYHTEPFSSWEFQSQTTPLLPPTTSLLPILRYNVRYRKIESKTGGARIALRTIMSPSLLFYRLACHFGPEGEGEGEGEDEERRYGFQPESSHPEPEQHLTGQENPNPESESPIHKQTPVSTTRVWQVEVVHRETGTRVLFMDDRGFFDIRAQAAPGEGSEGGEEGSGIGDVAMSAIVELVNALYIEDDGDPNDE